MEKSKIETLSAREKEVLKLVCQRYTEDQIGEMLNISGRTVGEYKKRIRKKLEVYNLLELASHIEG